MLKAEAGREESEKRGKLLLSCVLCREFSWLHVLGIFCYLIKKYNNYYMIKKKNYVRNSLSGMYKTLYIKFLKLYYIVFNKDLRYNNDIQKILLHFFSKNS